MIPPVVIMAINDPGERDFMISLYNDYHHVMFAVSYKILHNKELAEDAVSAVFVKLIDKITTIMEIDRGTLRAYVISAAKNSALNLAEKNARAKTASMSLCGETENGYPSSDDVEYSVLRQETVRRMADALECLRPRDREILRMRYYDEMPDEEIAEVIGTKASTVRMCLTRARNRLLRVCKERGIEI